MLFARSVVAPFRVIGRRAISNSSRRMMMAMATPKVQTFHKRPQQPIIKFTNSRFYAGGPPPLTKEFVQERIIDVLAGCDKIADPAKITPTAHFSNDLGLDSLDVVDVLFFIEEEFNIEIPDIEADEIHTVGQAVDYILQQPDAF